MKFFLPRNYGLRVIKAVKRHGLLGACKKMGWRLVAAIFLIYLVRDSIIYIVIPLLLYHSF